MTMQYALHPLSTLFPRLIGAEFDSLVADIKTNGLREPIVLHGGMILDGGNRAAACEAAGVEPQYVEFSGGNIVTFVLSANLHRRHLSPGQAAAIVASAQDWAKAQTVGNPQWCNVAPLATVADRSAQSGASVRTQKSADKVAKADPDLARKVAHGDVTLPAAVAKVEGKSPKESKPKHSKADTGPTPVVEQTPEYTPLDQAMDTVRELQDALALANAGHLSDEDKTQAAELIARLREENRILTLKLKAMTAARDGFMTQVAELKKQCAMQRKELDKLK